MRMSKRVMSIGLLVVLAVLVGCKKTEQVVGVKEEMVYCRWDCDCMQKYEQPEKVYFACAADAQALGYKPNVKCECYKKMVAAEMAAKSKADAKETAKAKKAAKAKAKPKPMARAKPKPEARPTWAPAKAKAAPAASSCSSCPMAATCDRKPGPYTGPVLGCKSDRIYRKVGCPCLKNIKASDQVPFKCKKAAAKAGYKPCMKCDAFRDKPTAAPAQVKPAAKPVAKPAPRPMGKAVRKPVAK